MQTLLAFKEAGFALLAVMLPIIWATLIISNYRKVREYRCALDIPDLYQGTHRHCEREIDELKFDNALDGLLIHGMLLCWNITLFTVPFGRSHGWW
ncbi:MAG: hypothetical protein AAB375_02565 [Patescibacteria group bacterium]